MGPELELALSLAVVCMVGNIMGAGEIGSFPYLDSDFEHYCSSFLFKRYGTTGAVVAEKSPARRTSCIGDLERVWEAFG